MTDAPATVGNATTTSVKVWADEYLVPSTLSALTSPALRAVYVKWCAEKNIAPLSPVGFGKAMAKLYPRIRGAHSTFACSFKTPMGA